MTPCGGSSPPTHLPADSAPWIGAGRHAQIADEDYGKVAHSSGTGGRSAAMSKKAPPETDGA